MNTTSRTHSNQPSRKPLGIIDALSAGISVVSRRPWLLLLPLLLDLFLWLAPPLALGASLTESLSAPFDPSRYSGGELPPTVSAEMPLALETVRSALGGANLWHILVLPVLFFPSTMVSAPPGGVSGASVQLATLPALLGSITALLALGLALNVVWLELVALGVRGERASARPGALFRRSAQHALRIAGMFLLLLLALVGLLFPISLLVAFITALAPALGQGMASLLAIGTTWAALWVGLHLYFAPGAIVLHDAPILQALGASARLVRATFWSAFGFIALSAVLSVGFQVIWIRLGAGSAAGQFVSILGNAALGTAIAAAMFIFYHDRARALAASATTQPASGPDRASIER